MTRILLDTSAYAAFKRDDTATHTAIRIADEIILCVPVLAELRAGFQGGSRASQNISELEEFRSSARVITPPMGEQTALFYAGIYHQLKKQGTPIPINDVWIAACTMETGSILFTQDSHFSHIAGLLINTL